VPTVSLSDDQRYARLCEVVKDIVARCATLGRALVLEDLDFARKKQELGSGPEFQRNYYRQLSGLAYAEFRRTCEARAADAGVEFLTVDPAYTSTQGLVRYRTQCQGSIHLAAAGVIARRGLGYSEKAPVRGTVTVPVVGSAVEWAIPAEIARCDGPRRWQKLHQGIRQAVVSHFRARRGAARHRPARPGGGPSKVGGETPPLNGTKRAGPAPGPSRTREATAANPSSDKRREQVCSG